MTKATPQVYIVDDDAAMRDSLALWIGMRGHRTRTFANAEAFAAEARSDWRGCAIIDVRLGGMDGLQLQTELARQGVALPIIFVTGYGDVATTRAALKAGAFDFVEKPIDNDYLLELVNSALAQDEQIAEQVARIEQAQWRIERLTKREREVMQLVVEGKHNREIAAALDISPRTVEVYKARLMDKLDVRRVPDLVRLVLDARNAEGSARQN